MRRLFHRIYAFLFGHYRVDHLYGGGFRIVHRPTKQRIYHLNGTSIRTSTDVIEAIKHYEASNVKRSEYFGRDGNIL